MSSSSSSSSSLPGDTQPSNSSSVSSTGGGGEDHPIPPTPTSERSGGKKKVKSSPSVEGSGGGSARKKRDKGRDKDKELREKDTTQGTTTSSSSSEEVEVTSATAATTTVESRSSSLSSTPSKSSDRERKVRSKAKRANSESSSTPSKTTTTTTTTTTTSTTTTTTVSTTTSAAAVIPPELGISVESMVNIPEDSRIRLMVGTTVHVLPAKDLIASMRAAAAASSAWYDFPVQNPRSDTFQFHCTRPATTTTTDDISAPPQEEEVVCHAEVKLDQLPAGIPIRKTLTISEGVEEDLISTSEEGEGRQLTYQVTILAQAKGFGITFEYIFEAEAYRRDILLASESSALDELCDMAEDLLGYCPGGLRSLAGVERREGRVRSRIVDEQLSNWNDILHRRRVEFYHANQMAGFWQKERVARAAIEAYAKEEVTEIMHGDFFQHFRKHLSKYHMRQMSLGGGQPVGLPSNSLQTTTSSAEDENSSSVLTTKPESYAEIPRVREGSQASADSESRPGSSSSGGGGDSSSIPVAATSSAINDGFSSFEQFYEDLLEREQETSQRTFRKVIGTLVASGFASKHQSSSGSSSSSSPQTLAMLRPTSPLQALEDGEANLRRELEQMAMLDAANLAHSLSRLALPQYLGKDLSILFFFV